MAAWRSKWRTAEGQHLQRHLQRGRLGGAYLAGSRQSTVWRTCCSDSWKALIFARDSANRYWFCDSHPENILSAASAVFLAGACSPFVLYGGRRLWAGDGDWMFGYILLLAFNTCLAGGFLRRSPQPGAPYRAEGREEVVLVQGARGGPQVYH